MSDRKSSKQAQYFDKAEILFVELGYSPEEIAGRTDIKVSRKTIYNWRNEFMWDEKRKRFLENQNNLREDLMNVTRVAIREYKTSPSPARMAAIRNGLNNLTLINTLTVLEEERSASPTGKGITEEIIRQIEHELGLA